MKMKIIPQPEKFQPYTVELTIENADEKADLQALLDEHITSEIYTRKSFLNPYKEVRQHHSKNNRFFYRSVEYQVHRRNVPNMVEAIRDRDVVEVQVLAKTVES